jgi:hypothetical protein
MSKEPLLLSNLRLSILVATLRKSQRQQVTRGQIRQPSPSATSFPCTGQELLPATRSSDLEFFRAPVACSHSVSSGFSNLARSSDGRVVSWFPLRLKSWWVGRRSRGMSPLNITSRCKAFFVRVRQGQAFPVFEQAEAKLVQP